MNKIIDSTQRVLALWFQLFTVMTKSNPFAENFNKVSPLFCLQSKHFLRVLNFKLDTTGTRKITCFLI